MFYDALVHPETLALAERAEKIAVGKRCGKHSTLQRFINKRLIDAARKHAVVVRLKGGDPMLFGRAQEEIRSGPANLNSTISGNSGYKAGSKAVWEQGVSNGEEEGIGTTHTPYP